MNEVNKVINTRPVAISCYAIDLARRKKRKLAAKGIARSLGAIISEAVIAKLGGGDERTNS